MGGRNMPQTHFISCVLGLFLIIMPAHTVSQGSCPDGSDPVSCVIDPCELAVCPLNPAASCVSSFCGGCNTKWFLNDVAVECGEENLCAGKNYTGAPLIDTVTRKKIFCGVGQNHQDCRNGAVCLGENVCCAVRTHVHENCSFHESYTCDYYADCVNDDNGVFKECICKDGYQGDGLKDEGHIGCQANDKKCTADIDCAELDAKCVSGYCKCPSGYERIPGSQGCRDINECEQGKCDANANCNNSPGSYTCACKLNYRGTGYGVGSCEYICKVDLDCSANETCQFSNCVCRPGYERVANRSCEDIDECVKGLDQCIPNTDCTNVVGYNVDNKGYTCACKEGYYGSPSSKCTAWPRTCHEVLLENTRRTSGRFKIDPDGPGGNPEVEVYCKIKKYPKLLGLTRVDTAPVKKILTASDPHFDVTYNIITEQATQLAGISGYCSQEMSAGCRNAAEMLSGNDYWLDSKGRQHRTWGGATVDGMCACGQVRFCVNSTSHCNCDGKTNTWYADKGRILNKEFLPITGVHMALSGTQKMVINIYKLWCGPVSFDIPTDCDDAKRTQNIYSNGPQVIDIDGPDGELEPILVHCNMTAHPHVGITVIPHDHYDPSPATTPGVEKLNYTVRDAIMKKIIENSAYCRQNFRYYCKNAAILGEDAFLRTIDGNKLDYWPGGSDGKCACGMTGTCEDPTKVCNCQIKDGKIRTDFGQVNIKKDMPIGELVIKDVGGSGQSVEYFVGPLECSQQEFGIEKNCQGWIKSGFLDDYSYLVDPDGPAPRQSSTGNNPPFLVVCKMHENPNYGETIVHHNNEDEQAISLLLYYHYKFASQSQLTTLVTKSTYCTQKVTYKCSANAAVHDENGDSLVSWQSPDGSTHYYLGGVEGSSCECGNKQTCSDPSKKCNCDKLGVPSSDEGTLAEKKHLPMMNMTFTKISEGSVSVGPLSCFELYPTCNDLENARKANKLVNEGKSTNGFYTVWVPGVNIDPVQVKCKFPQTIVPVNPDDFKKKSTVNNNETVTECFEIKYNGGVSPEQMQVITQYSDYCRQHVTYKCKNAPKSGNVIYKTCDGKTHLGWGSEGKELCKCGVTGNCDDPDLKCNCDLEDGLIHTDEGWIHNKTLLPVCEICITLDPTTDDAPSREGSYVVSDLFCGKTQTGVPGSCQDSRDSGVTSDDTYVIDPDGPGVGVDPFPVFCSYTADPPSGVTITKPKEDEYPVPNNGTVEVIYYLYEIYMIEVLVNRSVYCEQEVYYLCSDSTPRPESDEFRSKPGNWIVTAEGVLTCQNCDCSTNQAYGGYVVKKGNLPAQKIVIPAPIEGSRIELGPLKCYNVYPTCHAILQADMDTNPLENNRYAIDPDGAGGVPIFGVTCDFESKPGVGATVVKTSEPSEFVIIGYPIPGSFPINITYPNVTVSQIQKLTSVSGFCHQNMWYECKGSPLIGDNNPADTYVVDGNGNAASSFGTGSYSDVTGCSCVITGDCPKGHNCNCDVKGPMVTHDYGTVTDKEFLPVIQLNAGGQDPDGKATAGVSQITCGPKPVGLPKDCEEVLNNRGLKPGQHMIQPVPEVDPFFVNCEKNPETGTVDTTIKNNRETPTDVDYTKDNSITVEYNNVTIEQVTALISISELCYQAVVYDCFNTVFLGGGKFYWVGRDGKTFEYFGSSNNNAKECTCGAANKCGGNETEAELRKRKCSCDAGESQWRKDGGIFKIKDDLPVISLTFKAILDRPDVKGYFSLGELRCSKTKYNPDECKMKIGDEDVHDCDSLANCVNSGADFGCNCKVGYHAHKVDNRWANGRNCYDDEECLAGKCPPHSSNCTNTPGSYYCTCLEGWEKGTNTPCKDINECTRGIHKCHPNAECINKPGSYVCRCKYGFFGDGYNCTSVGMCTCFGDPHCLSFDQKWLHFQGKCQYLMAKDGCEPNEVNTFEVLSTFWDWGRNVDEATHVKETKVRVKNGDKIDEIELMQKHVVRVNNIDVHVPYPLASSAASSFFTITRVGYWTNLKTHVGLEVNWDGDSVLEIMLANSYQNQTCGLCGNYNLSPDDDWKIGDFCPPNMRNTITTNENVFGNSHVVKSYHDTVGCKADCNAPPPGKTCQTQVEKDKANYECDRIFRHQKFKECLRQMDSSMTRGLRQSCLYDACRLSEFVDGVICNMSRAFVKNCRENFDVSIVDWREEGFCYIKCDDPNEEFLYVGSSNMTKSCYAIENNFESLTGSEGNEEGCFCKEGYLMDRDRCIKEDECGCKEKDNYLSVNETLVLKDCTKYIKCVSKDKTMTESLKCNEEHGYCGTKDGVYGCHCKKGYMGDGVDCVLDPCGPGPCNHLPHAYCVPDGENYICKCKMGFTGNCEDCKDIDECDTKTDECGRHTECENTVGSYTCKCKKGFEKRNGKCVDINECNLSSTHDCVEGITKCQNTIGGHKCEPCQNENPVKKCCLCRGFHCRDEGRVCGDDGEIYNSEKEMALAYCEKGKHFYNVKVNYHGECKAACGNVVCDKYKECIMNEKYEPECECEECDQSDPINQQQVCDEKLNMYQTVCEFKQHMCKLGLQYNYTFDVTPCQKKSGNTPVTDWSPWTPCTVTCGTGARTRKRNATKELNAYEVAAYPLTITDDCYQPPCVNTSCAFADCNFTTGQECVQDEVIGVQCICPNCTYEDEEPYCGRVGNRNRNFKNPCLIQQMACLVNEPFERLYAGKCGVEPVDCEARPYRKTHKSSDGQCLKKGVNIRHCEGGCKDLPRECCKPNFVQEEITLDCVNGTQITHTIDVIESCECVNLPPPPGE